MVAERVTVTRRRICSAAAALDGARARVPCRRARPAPRRRGPARADLRAARRPRLDRGVRFAVWAPNARGVSVVGDCNGWDGRAHPLRPLGASGIWERFVPESSEGARYKFEIRRRATALRLKADPFASAAEVPPKTASRRLPLAATVGATRSGSSAVAPSRSTAPLSIYEVHLARGGANPPRATAPSRTASSRRARRLRDRPGLHPRRAAARDGAPVLGLVGLPDDRLLRAAVALGTPDDFGPSSTTCTGAGIGVILDWVPAHFPRDEYALARFDGTRAVRARRPAAGRASRLGHARLQLRAARGAQLPARERAVLAARYHVDGLRVDAVASMLYLDYSRKPGEWVPNQYGGRENLDAVAFLQELNEVVHGREPAVVTIAEESTAWPSVSRPTYLGGLGFGFKWNMGWMHDTLAYFAQDPMHRRYHHDELTFALVYACTENFILPLSHDEVVHGKGSLLGEDARRRVAAIRQPAPALRLHVGASGQEAPVHGRRARAVAGVEPRSVARLAPARGPRSRGVQALVRDLNPRTARSPRCGSWTSHRRVPLDGAQRGDRECAGIRAAVTGRLAVARLHARTSRRSFAKGWRVGLPGGGSVARGAQHGFPVLRGLGRGQRARSRCRRGCRGTNSPGPRRSRCRRWPSSGSCPTQTELRMKEAAIGRPRTRRTDGSRRRCRGRGGGRRGRRERTGDGRVRPGRRGCSTATGLDV